MATKQTPVLKLRGVLEDAGWQAREAAGTVEETVVWRGTDAARDLAKRAGGLARRAGESRAAYIVRRLRSLIERRLVWPLTDALRDRGPAVQTTVATSAVIAALAAITGGALVASGGEEISAAPGLTASTSATVSGETLEGVSPNFVSAQESPSAAPAGRAEAAPKDPAGRAAWDFAQAFVLYEVGKADEVADRFEQVASPALASALSESPPRLPADVKVPEARVLNVVVSDPQGKKEELVEASVSLVRLQAVSELRLSLRRGKDGWRVIEVRG